MNYRSVVARFVVSKFMSVDSVNRGRILLRGLTAKHQDVGGVTVGKGPLAMSIEGNADEGVEIHRWAC